MRRSRFLSPESSVGIVLAKVFRENDFFKDQQQTGSLERKLDLISANTLKGTSKPLDSSDPTEVFSLEYKRISNDQMELHGTSADGSWTVTFTRDTPAMHMANLEPFIGTWKHESKVTEAFGPVKEGDLLKLTSAFSWKIDKSAVLLEWTFQKNDEPPVHGIELLGWDRESDSIRSIMQTTDGSQDSGTWTCDGNTLAWTGFGLDAAGAKTAGEVRFIKAGKDELAWQFVNQSVNGKSLPDSSIYKYERVK